MAPSFEEGKLNHLTLILRQRAQLALEEPAQIRADQIIVDLTANLGTGLLFELQFETILGPAVSLTTTQPIDRAASRQSYDPAQWPARFGGLICRLFPDLEKNFLQDIVRLGLFVDDARNDRF